MRSDFYLFNLWVAHLSVVVRNAHKGVQSWCGLTICKNRVKLYDIIHKLFLFIGVKLVSVHTLEDDPLSYVTVTQTFTVTTLAIATAVPVVLLFGTIIVIIILALKLARRTPAQPDTTVTNDNLPMT